MKRVVPASALLVVGSVLLAVALPLRWQTVAATRGTTSVSATGLDYAGYDIAVTAVFALLLVAAAVLLVAGWRWAAVFAVMTALLACLWAALVFLAAGYPAGGGSGSGVTVTVGAGVFVLSAGALVALIGSALSFRVRGVPALAREAQLIV
jgi:hypothetical protein